MKLAMSNIAWDPQDRHTAYALMGEAGFAGLEIAPGLTFPGEEDAFRPSPNAVAAFRADCADHGLTPISMQSLLFGVSGAQIFGTAQELARFEQAMARAIDLAEMLGIPNLVFGSPKNRAYPDGMAQVDAETHAMAVFARLGERARAAGAVIAVEPNPAAYGTNFLTTVEAAATFVAAMAHPGVTLNYDIGALHMNGEAGKAGALYERAAGHVSHVHVSEPNLAPAPADPDVLADIARALLVRGYDGYFSIEMRCPADNVLERIETSLRDAKQAIEAAGSQILAK